jgi:folate-binding protein YgfZ
MAYCTLTFMTSTSEPAVAATAYNQAREDAVSFPLADRALLIVSGPLRQKFLQGLLSNDVASRTSGHGCRAALMDAKGHLLAFLRVLVADDEVVLEVPAARRDEVERLLNHYRVAAPVRFAKSSEVVIGLGGPRVIERLRALDASTTDLAPESHLRVMLGGPSVRLVRAGDLPVAGYVLHVPEPLARETQDLLTSAGFGVLETPTLDALRIEEGRAWYGTDVTAQNLLHDTGLVSEYHSPTKGCYIGQENVARLEARGAHTNQRLRGFKLSEARPAGTVLRADGKEVGAFTTAAVSPRQGPIAMGYVHRSQMEPGTMLEADGARAEVAVLPMAPA